LWQLTETFLAFAVEQILRWPQTWPERILAIALSALIAVLFFLSYWGCSLLALPPSLTLRRTGWHDSAARPPTKP